MSLTSEVFKSNGGKCRIEISGRLDTTTAPGLEETFNSIDFDVYPIQIADLANLDYVSSAGIRVLFKAKKKATAAGGNFVLVNPKPSVKKVFDIVKALPSESIFTSMEELDAYLDRMQRSV